MSIATESAKMELTKTILVKGKYPAKEWDGAQMVEIMTHKNIRCAVMGGSFFIKASNDIASQMQESKSYEVTFSVNEYISQKGQLSYPANEIIKFKPVN